MNIAIIPARGGSKRIPRKNIREFAGKPMLAYAIETAQSSGLFAQILVSTDDAEIADVARRYGADVPFMRPASLADDVAPTVPVIAHAIREYAQANPKPLRVCCIYPAVPFLVQHDLEQALHVLEQSAAEYAFPVARYASPIQRALRKLPDGSMQPFNSQYAAIRTQDLEPAYHDAGQFYWGNTQAWLDEKNVHMHGMGYEIPSWRAIDIDTPDDWQRAELIYRAISCPV